MINKLMEITGKIISGRGKANKNKRVFEIIAYLNVTYKIALVSGTLNLVTSKPYWLREDKAIFKSNDNKALVWDCELNGNCCFIYRLVSMPAHVYEIISDIRLRDKYHLKDNDNVIINIPNEYIAIPNYSRVLYWHLFWKYREIHYYKSNYYVILLNKLFRYKSKYRTGTI